MEERGWGQSGSVPEQQLVWGGEHMRVPEALLGHHSPRPGRCVVALIPEAGPLLSVSYAVYVCLFCGTAVGCHTEGCTTDYSPSFLLRDMGVVTKVCQQRCQEHSSTSSGLTLAVGAGEAASALVGATQLPQLPPAAPSPAASCQHLGLSVLGC